MPRNILHVLAILKNFICKDCEKGYACQWGWKGRIQLGNLPREEDNQSEAHLCNWTYCETK